MLAFGIVCALVERQRSGKGQVVDAAMVDGAAALMAMVQGLRLAGGWDEVRGNNLLDTGAHFYDAYECKDGKYVAIGSIEPHFYAELIKRLGLGGESLPAQMDKRHWPELKRRFTEIFRSKTRAEWCALMEGSDVCFAPVLSMAEAAEHPHNRTRATFVGAHGVVQPAPVPRFSRTAPSIQGPSAHPGQHTEAALADWGLSSGALARLRAEKAIA
jgi:alpha-methylacyl-CoA racemase